MASLLLLIVCLVLGALLRRLLPDTTPLVLNRLLVGLFIPALTLLYIPDMHYERRILLPVLAPWLVFGGACALLWPLGVWLRFDRSTIGALLLTGGISSVSFVGFPVFSWLYGQPGLEMGILMSQAGTFVVCVTAGVALASWLSAQEPSGRRILRDMVRFPPFAAFGLALLLNMAGYHHPALLRELLTRLSTPFTVLALLSVGMQLHPVPGGVNKKALAIGLGYKLALAPALVFGVYQLGLGERGWLGDLCVLGSALGPMNTAAVLATQFRLNPPLAAQMVGIGIPLSFIVLYLIYNLL